MSPRLLVPLGLALAGLVFAQPAAPTVDLAAFRPEPGVDVRRETDGLTLRWPISATERGELGFNLEPNKPLIARFAVGPADALKPARTLLEKVDPVTLLTIGERDMKNPAGWVA